MTNPAPESGPVGELRTVIAVLTYRRPDDLAEMLPYLLEQSGTISPPATIIVVDNDASGSARETVEAFGSALITYVVESTPGIAAARNRALQTAAGQDILIFIDDDEHPSPGWLAAMIDTYREHRSAAVVGPVVSEFESDLDPWIVAGGFFERNRSKTGTAMHAAATNNLLLDLHQIADLGLSFDPAFGLTGGSDHLFTRQLVTAGRQIIWCDQAVVTDRVPASRMTHRWVLLRQMRYGNSGSRTELALAGGGLAGLRTRVRMIGLGLVRIGGGAARAGVGVVTRSTRHRARGTRTMMKGVGYLLGAIGGTYTEYRRKHH